MVKKLHKNVSINVYYFLTDLSNTANEQQQKHEKQKTIAVTGYEIQLLKNASASTEGTKGCLDILRQNPFEPFKLSKK